MVLILGAAAGASNAVTYLGGRVFASVMTGNLVLVGVSASTRDGALALRAGLALCGYVAGALVGTRRCQPALTRAWPTGVVPVLVVELAGLAVVAVVRGIWPGTNHGALEVSLILTAASMGLQSAVGRAAPVRPRSTTYLTGALTEVVASLAAGPGLVRESETVVIFAAAVIGAGAAAALEVFVPRVAPTLAVVLVATALVLVVGDRRGERTDRAV